MKQSDMRVMTSIDWRKLGNAFADNVRVAREIERRFIAHETSTKELNVDYLNDPVLALAGSIVIAAIVAVLTSWLS